MTNNAYAIGQLLANSALMQGERQLLRKQPEAAENVPKSPPQPKAAPIAANNMTGGAMLLTLLDEQLQASEMGLAGRLQNAIPPDNDTNSSTRIAARYAADALNSGDEPLPAGQTFSSDPARIASIPTPVSGDLQTFMQRSAVLAAERTNENAGGKQDRHLPGAQRFSYRASQLYFAGGATALILIAAPAAKWMMP